MYVVFGPLISFLQSTACVFSGGGEGTELRRWEAWVSPMPFVSDIVIWGVCAFECQGPVGESVSSGTNYLCWTSGRVFALSLSFSISKMGMGSVPAT